MEKVYIAIFPIVDLLKMREIRTKILQEFGTRNVENNKEQCSVFIFTNATKAQMLELLDEYDDVIILQSTRTILDELEAKDIPMICKPDYE